MRMLVVLTSTVLALCMSISGCDAESGSADPAKVGVTNFDQTGLLVQASSFFDAAQGHDSAPVVQPHTADRALVTADAEKRGPAGNTAEHATAARF